MNIKELKANKKNRNLVLYLRKVVESYRAGFVSSKELKTDLHMDFKRVRQLIFIRIQLTPNLQMLQSARI